MTSKSKCVIYLQILEHIYNYLPQKNKYLMLINEEMILLRILTQIILKADIIKYNKCKKIKQAILLKL